MNICNYPKIEDGVNKQDAGYTMHDTGCRMTGCVFDFPASHYFAAASAGTNSMRCRSRGDLPISVILNAVLNLFQDLFQNCFRISYY
jgi:hypothetical protein